MMESSIREAGGDQLCVEVPRGQLGIEVLRAVPTADGAYLVLSVPVFVYGISRGSVVAAHSGQRGRLQFAGIRRISPGATIRAWVSPTTTPKHVDDDYFKGPIARKLGLGPATLFEPTTVAVHLSDRARMKDATRYLDGLIRLGVLTAWEFGDPGAPATADAQSLVVPWEVVHPPASDSFAPDAAT